MEQFKDGISIITFDGGSIPHAMTQIAIAGELLARIRAELDLDRTPLLVEYFEVIGGVGIGAIIALLFGRFRLSTEEVIEELVTISMRAFSTSGVDGFLDVRNLKEAIQDLSEKYLFDRHARLLDTTHGSHVFICTEDQNRAGSAHSRTFRTYPVRKLAAVNCSIWEAVQASVAYPGFFPGAVIEDETFVGYSLGNPINEALKEAEMIFGEKQSIKAILSLGAGKGELKSIKELPGVESKILGTLERLGLSSERLANETAYRFQEVDFYSRFNISLDEGDAPSDLWSNPKHEFIMTSTRSQVVFSIMSQRLDEAVAKLVSQKGVMEIRELNRHSPPDVTPKPRPPLSRTYVQRPEQQEFVERALFSPLRTASQRRCVLHGLGGSGKTQIASYIVRKYQDCVWRVFYIDASSQAQIEADLCTAIRSISKRFNDSTWEKAVSYLSDERRPWIILFDNADVIDLPLERYFPDSPSGKIILTTRNRECSSYAPDSHIQIAGLTEPEAVELLHTTARLQPTSSEESIAIVQELGCLALPIIQAGAYMSRTRRLDTFLQTFQKHREKLMRNNEIHKSSDYNWSTYTSLELSFELLPPKSRKFVNICSFLHHSLIPQELFEKSSSAKFRSRYTFEGSALIPDDDEVAKELEDLFGAEWDEFEFHEIIDPLTRYSLLDITIDLSSRFFLNFHPLVQACARDLQTESIREKSLHCATHLVSSSIQPVHPHELRMAQEFEWRREIISHIEAIPPLAQKCHILPALAFLDVYEEVKGHNKTYELAEFCTEGLSKTLGEHHFQTIKCSGKLAHSLRGSSQYARAEKILQSNLDYLKSAKGEDHPETLKVMNDVSISLKDMGHYERAAALQTRALELQEKTQDQPEILRGMGILASTLVELGQFEKASSLFHDSIERHTTTFGLIHPRTVEIKVHLLLLFSEWGKLDGLEALQIETIELAQQVFGRFHLQTLLAKSFHASTLAQLGKFQESEDLKRELLELYKRVSGPKSRNVLNAMINLSNELLHNKKYEEAERMQREVLSLQIEILGPRNINTVIAMHNLAETLYETRQLEDCETMQREVVVLFQETLGPKNPLLCHGLDNLSQTLITSGRLEEAKKMSLENFQLREEILGSKHPDTIKSLSRYSDALAADKQYELALPLASKAATMSVEVLGPQHPDSLQYIEKLGDIQEKAENVELVPSPQDKPVSYEKLWGVWTLSEIFIVTVATYVSKVW